MRLLKKTKNILSGYQIKSKNENFYRKSTPSFKRAKNVKCAVVIHLFYTDNWPLFSNKLSNLKGHAFDLYITVPVKNIKFTAQIEAMYPHAQFIVVPNHGRDVLPFIKTAKKLYEAGYEYVLKFHSKKSTHRDDGQDWLESMLDRLLPNDARVMDAIFNKLNSKTTGIVGPEGVYYPLTVNFPANGAHMTEVVQKLHGKKAAHEYLQVHRSEYGFFGGTMFWARLDAIKDLLNFSVFRFEIEKGQIDATFAHALERLFSVVPEMNSRKNYEVTTKEVRPRPYESDNIPEWSEDHLK